MANQNAWVKVMFEVSFDSIPIVEVTPLKNSFTSFTENNFIILEYLSSSYLI